jgi:hypothetical protein
VEKETRLRKIDKEADMKEQCPHLTHKYIVDNLYSLCLINNKACLVEQGLECEEYKDYLRELEHEEEFGDQTEERQ